MLRHYPLNPSTGLEDASLLPWANGNPTTGTEGSYPPFGLFTDAQEEILAAIQAAGLVAGGDLTQLSQSISILSRLAHGSARFMVGGTYSWVCPAGVTKARARGWGGGGGGSGGGNSAGCGGGYFEGIYTVVPGTAYPVIVGPGGAGNSGTGTGGVGGTTSFSSFASSTGGAGGTSGPGVGGSGSGGSLVNLQGGRGEDVESANYYAQGGMAPFGGIGFYQGALAPGGGGSATSSSAVIGASGANGADGAVFLDW